MEAGYSGTPLATKLGIKAGDAVSLISAPKDAATWLEPLPEEVMVANGVNRRAAVSLLFVSWRYELEAALPDLSKVIFPDRALWICWPKKAAKLPGDMTEDVIRELGLPIGLVDNKVCAVTETWSGLRLVWRKELRERPTL